MTQRQHQLSFCEICRNKAFSPKKGIICELTQSMATFNQNCNDFDEDPALKRMTELSNEAKKIDATRESTFGLSAIGITNGTIAGIVYIILGVVSVFMTVFAIQMVTIWSFVLIIIGIVLIVKAAIKPKTNRGKKKNQLDLLDDELL